MRLFEFHRHVRCCMTAETLGEAPHGLAAVLHTRAKPGRSARPSSLRLPVPG